MMLISVLMGYLPEPECMVELTCLSNTAAGILLIVEEYQEWKYGQTIFSNAYLIMSATLFLVFVVCTGSLSGAYHMNMSGAFFFLHVVNPIAFLIIYFTRVNERKHSIRKCFLSPLFVMLYLVFDYSIGYGSGHFVYGFITPQELGIFQATVIAVILYGVVYFMGVIAFCFNQKLHANKGEIR